MNPLWNTSPVHTPATDQALTDGGQRQRRHGQQARFQQVVPHAAPGTGHRASLLQTSVNSGTARGITIRPVSARTSSEGVFIINVVKSQPFIGPGPGRNRAPLGPEVAACRPWLDEQLRIIRPEIVVPMGRIALESFLPGASISSVHGRPLRRAPAARGEAGTPRTGPKVANRQRDADVGAFNGARMCLIWSSWVWSRG